MSVCVFGVYVGGLWSYMCVCIRVGSCACSRNFERVCCVSRCLCARMYKTC